jgi:cyclopropane fatty-acyl-phospholipid synthase-like methyltransferase
MPAVTEKNVYEEFFDEHAPFYMENVFTKNTAAEVEFIVEALGLVPGDRVLDMGCGTGRHSVALARRGLRMTGVDLSSGMLAEARKAARDAGVEVEWIHGDATRFQTDRTFDAAISLCEGAFGLLGQHADAYENDRAILRNMSRPLKLGGKVMMTVLNGMAMIRRYKPEDVENGRFDPKTITETHDLEADSATGKVIRRVRERGYVPTELGLMFPRAGLKILHLGGGTAGNWGRRPLELDEIEIMVIAEKTGEVSA